MEVGSALEIVLPTYSLEDRLRKLKGNIATVITLKINQRSLTMMKNRMCGGSKQMRVLSNTLEEGTE